MADLAADAVARMAAMQKVFMFEANCEEEDRWVSFMDVGARTIFG